MTFIQLVTSLGQIDVGKVSRRMCDFFGVVGCLLPPLGELQSGFQYLNPWSSMISGGKTAGHNGERFDMLFNYVCTVIKQCKLW